MIWIKKNILIILLSLLFVTAFTMNEIIPSSIISFIVMALLTLLAGVPIFKKAVIDLRYKMIGIDLLVTIAVVAAFVIGDYFEAAAVTYLFTLGHILERKSLDKTRSALQSLMDLKPSFARVMHDGLEEMVALNSIQLEDIILVKPGEKIPTDGVIIEGNTTIDEQVMTGESMPVEKEVNSFVYGSTILLSGYIKMRATAIGEDTTLSRIIHMVEEAQDKKAASQKLIERFSKYYTPGVVIIALIIFVFTLDIRLAITMLVIACPGALVIATPVSYVAGIGNAAKKGILFKGGDSIERLAKGKIIFFDKTGTLTQGKPILKHIMSYGIDENQLLTIAAMGETFSEHPLATAIIEEALHRKLIITPPPPKLEMVIGKGIIFEYNNSKYTLGNIRLLLNSMPIEVQDDIQSMEDNGMTTLIMTRDAEVIGLFGIADAIRKESKQTMQLLKQLGINKIVMLTGDQERIAKKIALELGIQDYRAGLLPIDKAKIIEDYQQQKNTIFVGDGINDAVALSQAYASLAIGGLGKDLAMETADVVLLGERIDKLYDAIKISHQVRLNMYQNIGFALLVVLILMLGVVFQVVTMAIGMLIHELSVLLVLINAIRLLKYDLGGKYEKRFRTK